jgi:hypothetical protein
MLKHLKSQESLRVLDIGPTSSNNINYITGLGHSIYMANLVEEAARPEWIKTVPGSDPEVDVEGFLAQNLNFSGRRFDVVTLWDVPEFMPPALLPAVIQRLYEVTVPGAQVLALFHATPSGADTEFVRYHMTGSDTIDLQRAGNFKLRQTFTNRQIETLFKAFSSYRFFLAKDALREVIITR